MSIINITLGKNNMSHMEIVDLYEKVGFLSINNRQKYLMEYDNIFDKFFGDNIYVFCAFEKDKGKLIGLARIFSDDIIISYIAEVCVHPEYQKQGIGSKLIEAITLRFSHTSIFTCAFKGMEKMFLKHGLTVKEKLFACSRNSSFNSTSILN